MNEIEEVTIRHSGSLAVPLQTEEGYHVVAIKHLDRDGTWCWSDRKIWWIR